MKIFKYVLFFFIMLTSSFAQDSYKILYINSYHLGYSWSDDIYKGIQDKLKNTNKNIEISVEFLDAKRFPKGKHNEFLKIELLRKYSTYTPDIIIVSDNYAFDYYMSNREDFFKDVPLVFCGYNQFRPEVLDKYKHTHNITGINEEIALKQTVDLALKVQPETQNIVFVTSTKEATNIRNYNYLIKTFLPNFNKTKYKVSVLKDYNKENLEKELDKYSDNTIIFILGLLDEKVNSRTISSKENARIINEISTFPSYSFWKFYLGQGILGGSMLTGYQQGEKAGELALKILEGEKASNIPIIMNSPTVATFDYNVMKKFNIKKNRIPMNSIILNKEDSIWEEYKYIIISTILLVILQSLLIAYLYIVIKQRKNVLKELAFERNILEDKVKDRTKELEKKNNKLYLLANTDSLTGIKNRGSYFRSSEKLLNIAINEEKKFFILMIDIDHFKKVNDRYGHSAGDKVLKEFCNIVNLCIDKETIFGRIGGEEFCLTFIDKNIKLVEEISENIREKCEKTIVTFEDKKIRFTISLGLSEKEKSHNIDNILQVSDELLYKAKNSGRNKLIRGRED